MNGHIYSSLMLVSVGNGYLSGRDVGAFWPDANAFAYLKVCEFRRPPASSNDTDEYPLVAADPPEWFGKLKTDGRRGLRLHHTTPTRGPSQQLNVSDRMLAGMVGGGQRWLIEAAGEKESELWEPFNRVGDRNDPQRKIWLRTHILQAPAVPRADLDADVSALPLEETVTRLRAALVEVEAFARKQTYDNFADIFRDAIASLDGKGDPQGWMKTDTGLSGFGPRQFAILDAASQAWVFGGMGSWNDLPGGPDYDRVSQALYDALNDCIAALANSTFPG
jgi:hypothetical protein